MSSPTDRFDRQRRFAPLGPEGQSALEASRVLIVGCGATGGILAQELVRAGVGEIVLVDRDIVELSNLPRQVLFAEADATQGSLKVEAARRTLSSIGGPTQLITHADHLDADNLGEYAAGCDLILDGTDNLPTRYLINDYCVEAGLPWIYSGVVGSSGLILPVLPGKSACLRCLFPDPPPPGTLETCDSAGVLLPAVAVVGSVAAGFALRILSGRELDSFTPTLTSIDTWYGDMRSLSAEQRADCPACIDRNFPFLHAPSGRRPISLCGRNTVQIPGGAGRPDFAALHTRLAQVVTDWTDLGPMLRFSVEDFRITLFADGRALIEGTDDVDRARSVYDRLLA
ncbi:MAG: molybdopterin/thiamine biosynthesis adenylyltransferase [Planctomycetota bacterium]|jgi:molybdopterin/thiamine biosynthesis adenylyltransferase